MYGQKSKKSSWVLALAVIFSTAFFMGALCGEKKPPPKEPVYSPPVATNELLEWQCENYVGEPRVEKITDRVWVATAYDLANVILIHTDEGNVIVDTAMSPARARQIKAALEKEAPKAPVKAIIFTHTHIDHVGGAVVFADEDTQIWGTEGFTEHFLKQYGMFRPAETVRAMRQFGDHVDLESLPCSSIGKRTDITAAIENGVMLPDNTFMGVQKFTIGGVDIELHAAPGETQDQLFVWLPGEEVLIPGDNFYHTFPNLYTIRGTSRRPVREWVKSLDNMRSKNPEHLVPCHTMPVHGKEEIAKKLTDYRDAIQWVHDEVVRKANNLEDIDVIAETVKLPPHLAGKPYLHELYGQVDWSARAIYTNALGWFDGRADKLYPLPSGEAARREVELMGGTDAVMAAAQHAMANGETRWAIHLLAKLKKADELSEAQAKEVDSTLIGAYRELAVTIANTNGRAYLLETALEMEHGAFEPQTPNASQALIDAIPLDLIFSIMTVRLKTDVAMDVHQSVQFVFPDTGEKYVVTIRHGVAEIIEGEPLPFTPEPVAVITADAKVYREVALGVRDAAREVGAGRIKVKGSLPAMVRFLDLFESGI